MMCTRNVAVGNSPSPPPEDLSAQKFFISHPEKLLDTPLIDTSKLDKSHNFSPLSSLNWLEKNCYSHAMTYRPYDIKCWNGKPALRYFSIYRPVFALRKDRNLQVW